MQPVISIIVPVYNAELTLVRCVDSILNQTLTDFELLLVDDGSRDDSGRICDEYVKKDKRIRVFHKENGGVSSARNLGLSKAVGKWIAFADSDDWCDPLMYETLLSAAETNGFDIQFCGFWIVSNGKYYSCTPKSTALQS